MNKAWYHSKGMWGSIIAVAASASGLGLSFDPATGVLTGNVYQIAPMIGGLLGGVLAGVGRLTAKGPIKGR